jgi:DNA modification methylase
MGADTFGDAGGIMSGIEHHYDDSYDSWKKLMFGYYDSPFADPEDKWQPGWCELSYLVAKPQAHAYVFCDIDRFHELKAGMEAAGWYVFRTPMINVKSNSGRVPLPDQGPRRQYEILLYAIKGKKPVTHIYPDVITSVADENLSHGAQKPVSLYENLLQRSVRPGDSVLDSFAGSGTIFPACHTLHCYATGLEAAPEYYGMALKRLQSVKANDSLSFDFETEAK